MRTSIFSFSLLLVVACGDDKNTTDTEAATGGASSTTETTETTAATETGSTGASATTSGSETGASATTGSETGPGTTGEPTTGSTTQTSHASVTGESSSGGETTGESGSTGDESGSTDGESGSSGGIDPDGDAIVENDCAPNDGPALQFKLDVAGPECGAPLSGDQLRVLLWQGGPLAPGDYDLAPATGFATFQVGNDEPINSKSGTLTIESWIGDVIIGSYDLTFLDDSTRQGAFVGPFCQVMIGCG